MLYNMKHAEADAACYRWEHRNEKGMETAKKILEGLTKREHKTRLIISRNCKITQISFLRSVRAHQAA